MINIEMATKIVLDHLKERSKGASYELVPFLDETIEKDYGWVFFYNTKECAETDDPLQSLLGCGPLVITKVDGKVHELGSAFSLEYYLSFFENYNIHRKGYDDQAKERGEML